MKKYADYKGMQTAKRYLEKKADIEKYKEYLEVKQNELNELYEQQEKEFTYERTEDIAIRELSIKQVEAEVNKQVANLNNAIEFDKRHLSKAIEDDRYDLRKNHKELASLVKACNKALDEYRKANELYKKKALELVREYDAEMLEYGFGSGAPETIIGDFVEVFNIDLYNQ